MPVVMQEWWQSEIERAECAIVGGGHALASRGSLVK